MPLDAETIARHAEAVRALARTLVFDADRAEDVAQEAMLVALKQTTPPRKGFGPWLSGVTRRLAYNTARRERRQRDRDEHARPPTPTPEPEEVVARLQAQRRVGEALMALGDPYRRTLYLRFFEDLPPREIAARLDLPVNTVRTHLRRGLAKLRTELERREDPRRPWHAALAPLLRSEVPTPGPAAPIAAAGLGGTLLMAATTRHALIGIVLLLLGGSALYWAFDDAGDVPATEEAALRGVPGPATPTLEGKGREAGLPSTDHDTAAASGTTPEAAAEDTHPMRFTGRVRDPQGRALAGVSVRLHAAHGSGIALDVTTPLAEAHSDVEGRFVLELDTSVARRAPPSKDPWLRVHVMASHETWHYAAASFNVHTTEPQPDTRRREQIDLRFRAPFTVRCTVRDEAGHPVSGATCRWGSSGGYTPRPDGGYYEAITDTDGVATIHLAAIDDPASVFLHTTGVRNLHAYAEGYARITSKAIRIIQPEPGQVVEADLVLPEGHAVTARLVDDRRKPIAGKPVQVLLHGTDDVTLAWAHRLGNLPTTDDEGRLTLPHVPAGAYRAILWVPGYTAVQARLTAPGSASTVHIRRKTSVVVHYRRPDGRALFVNRYELSQDDPDGDSQGGSWGDEQPLELDDARAGRFRMRTWLAGRIAPFEHAMTLRTGPNDEITLTVPDPAGAVLEGRILGADGTPVASEVLLVPETEQPADEDEQDWENLHTVGADGRYRFEGLAAGRYALTVDAEDHASAQVTIAVDGAAGVITRDVKLRKGASLRVRIPGAPAEALFRWQVQVETSDGDGFLVRKPEVDEHGWLTLTMLPPGRTTVMLESTTFRGAPIPNDPYVGVVECRDGETVEHAFPHAAGITVDGHVLDAKGKAIGQHMLTLLRITEAFVPGKDEPRRSYATKHLFTDDQGRFKAHGLVPGRYMLLSVRAGGVPLTFRVGEEPTQAITLHAR